MPEQNKPPISLEQAIAMVKTEMEIATNTFNNIIEAYRNGTADCCTDCAIIHAFDRMNADELRGAAIAMLYWADDLTIDTEIEHTYWIHIQHATFCYFREIEKQKAADNDILSAPIIDA